VVFTGEDHIFHPRLAGPARPLLGVVKVGIEVLEIHLIVGIRDFLAVLQPFVTGAQRIKTPMDEHAKACFDEPGLLVLGQHQILD
jgi:hypothetical protein